MNSPDPIPPPSPAPGQSVMPAAPWYQSEVQVRLVLALVAQLVSILFRTLELFGIGITLTQADLDVLLANATQGAALLFAVLAIVKRQQSAVAPLTLTAKKAEQRQADNPALLAVDPKQLK